MLAFYHRLHVHLEKFLETDLAVPKLIRMDISFIKTLETEERISSKTFSTQQFVSYEALELRFSRTGPFETSGTGCRLPRSLQPNIIRKRDKPAQQQAGSAEVGVNGTEFKRNLTGLTDGDRF